MFFFCHLTSTSLPSGLWRTEMWRGGFPSGYELFGQIFVSGSYQENKTSTSGGYLHVSCVKDEGDGSIISGKTLYLYGPLCPPWRAAGNISRLLQQQNAVNYLNITPNKQKYTAILPSCLMWFAFLFDLFTANGAAGSEQTEVGLGFSDTTWFHWAFLVQAGDLPVHQAHPKKACSDFCCSLCHRWGTKSIVSQIMLLLYHSTSTTNIQKKTIYLMSF